MSRTKASDNRRLPYGRQSVDEDDIAAVAEVLRSDWLTTGPATEAFERELAETANARHAVACSSGTAALHLVSLALGLTQNDIAVVPAVTFLATANAPHLAGADIVFTDVNPETGLVTPETLQQALVNTTSAKAVFAVHLNGQMAPVEALAALANEHSMHLIEDGCHALGGRYRCANGEEGIVGDCRFSTATTFSFHPVKTITAGEGGAITTNDADLARQLRQLRNHGIEREPSRFRQPELARDADGSPNPWYYEMQSLGLNYRPSDIHCALGLSQLRKLSAFSARRRELMHLYDESIRELAPVVRPVPRVENGDLVLHLYAVLIDFDTAGTSRAAVMQALNKEGIGTQVHYIPVHQQPYYRERYGDSRLPGAEQYYARVLSLPFFPAMEDRDVERVVSALGKALNI